MSVYDSDLARTVFEIDRPMWYPRWCQFCSLALALIASSAGQLAGLGGNLTQVAALSALGMVLWACCRSYVALTRRDRVEHVPATPWHQIYTRADYARDFPELASPERLVCFRCGGSRQHDQHGTHFCSICGEPLHDFVRTVSQDLLARTMRDIYEEGRSCRARHRSDGHEREVNG